jgi:hypothetical protein
MSYKNDLIAKITDSEKWPDFERSDFLATLDGIAERAFSKKTLEGYLAALLIYHQLSEELVKLLIRDAQFLIQVSVFPYEINFPEKKKLMFGQLIDELKSTVEFDFKSDLIEKCVEVNALRITIVHKLTKHTSISAIQKQVIKVKNLYDEIFELFDKIHDNFRVDLHSYSKDIDWDEYLTNR